MISEEALDPGASFWASLMYGEPDVNDAPIITSSQINQQTVARTNPDRSQM
jgi:hypothetical protein